MKLTWKKVMLIMSMFALVLGGCSQNNVSAEEIIHNAIESEKDLASYFGKSEMKVYEGEELMEHTVMEEYVDGIKRKIINIDQLLEQEIIVLNDGENMTMYDEATGEAHKMNTSELEGFTGAGPKDQFISMMDMLKESHTHELVGEEEILGDDTYHIRMKANEKNGLIGDMEFWVDQKTWFIVKLVTETGDMKVEVTYTELDFSPKFSEDTFTIDIPEDVEITDLEEEVAPNNVTLEEAAKALEQPILTFSEDDAKLDSITMREPQGELNRYEVDMTFSSEEGAPLFMLSVFPTPEDMPISESDVEVRGNDAEYEEMMDAYLWDEDGLRYNLMVVNPDIKQEEILEITENMVLSSEE